MSSDAIPGWSASTLTPGRKRSLFDTDERRYFAGRKKFFRVAILELILFGILGALLHVGSLDLTPVEISSRK